MRSNHHPVSKEVEELVVARLSVIPEGKRISIGSKSDFTKEELIKHVRNCDDVGQKMVEVELKYLQAMKNIAGQVLANG